MLKNFVFDFGQVIVHFEPEYMTKQYIENPDDAKFAQDIIFDRLYWDKLDLGTITDEEIIDDIKNRLPENLYANAVKAYENWYMHLPFFDGMVELIKDLKASGKKLYLLSNISIGFAENYSRNPELKKLFDLFDGLIFSAKEGYAKPNKDIFEHLLNKFDLKAEETIFIDDNEKNIIGAKSANINAYLFDGDVKKLRESVI